MSNSKLINDLMRYNNSNASKALFKKYKTKSFFEILAKDTDELIHSKMLKWLFELDDLPCEWKSYPIMNLLDVILKRADSQNKLVEIDDDLRRAILLRNVKISVKNVQIEVPTLGVKINYKGKKESGRSDIVIECEADFAQKSRKLVICVENKIDTSEHNFQTWKYYAYFAGKELVSQSKINNEIDVYFENGYNYDKKEDEIQLFVFLTPHSDLEMDDIIEGKLKEACSCPHYIHINYQDIMNHVLINLQNLENLDVRTKSFVTEYMNTLSIPYIYNNRKHQIMAMSNEDSKLLADFWNENKQLILASLQAFVGDYNQEEEERDIANQALGLLSKSNTFSVVINGDKFSNLKMTDVTEKVAFFLIQKYKEKNSDKINKDSLGNINKQINCVPTFIIEKSEYDSKSQRDKARWRNIKDSADFYVTTEWKYFKNSHENENTNFKKFVKLIKNKWDIEVEKQ